MYSNFTPDQFEEFWAELITETNVEEHPWVLKTYENKKLWATAYLREKFFGRFRTTSQCEAVNAIIKTYIRRAGCIYEFMHNFDEVVRGYRNNEVVADYTSMSSEPVLTTQLPQLERDAGLIFTAAIFRDVRQEIMKAGPLKCSEKYENGGIKYYTVKKYCKDKYEREVVYDGDTFKCSCKLFETRGLPCSHIFYVMKEEDVEQIPRSLVMSRWTKDAKMEYLNVMDCYGSVDEKSMEEARFSAYCSTLTQFCREAAKREGVYTDIIEDIMRLQQKYCMNTDNLILTPKSGVRDPNKVNGKGAPKKKKMKEKLLGVAQYARVQFIMLGLVRCRGLLKVAKGTAVNGNVVSDSVSVSVDDSSFQTSKNKRRKTGGHGTTMMQNDCSVPSQNFGVVGTQTSHVDVTRTATPPTNGSRRR